MLRWLRFCPALLLTHETYAPATVHNDLTSLLYLSFSSLFYSITLITAFVASASSQTGKLYVLNVPSSFARLGSTQNWLRFRDNFLGSEAVMFSSFFAGVCLFARRPWVSSSFPFLCSWSPGNEFISCLKGVRVSISVPRQPSFYLKSIICIFMADATAFSNRIFECCPSVQPLQMVSKIRCDKRTCWTFRL